MIVATNDKMEYSKDEVRYEVYKKITQPKEWVDIDGGHFGLLYFPCALFDKSRRAQFNFLYNYLK